MNHSVKNLKTKHAIWMPGRTFNTTIDAKADNVTMTAGPIGVMLVRGADNCFIPWGHIESANGLVELPSGSKMQSYDESIVQPKAKAGK